jgi:hypothetical protein
MVLEKVEHRPLPDDFRAVLDSVMDIVLCRVDDDRFRCDSVRRTNLGGLLFAAESWLEQRL